MTVPLPDIEPRKGAPDPKLNKPEFRERFLSQYQDPAFDPLATELEKPVDAAWDGYDNARKSPRTRKAGPGFADPDYDLAVDWIAAKEAVDKAQARHVDATGPLNILLINGSSRNEHTCPGEISKSYRMIEIAKDVFTGIGERIAVEVLDLSRVTAEYGRNIHPCKGCFSTSAALCHWPCSCYPNYSLGQTQDWMNEIFPMWVRAHGVMIVTPVHWYQATSPLKLMIDRLVCADGANPDPTSTQGKKAKLAKELEIKGWDYRQFLAGRLFSVVTHGDVEGVENLRRSLSDWLTFMNLESAGNLAEIDRYIGYYKPYATNHPEFEADTDVQEEVRNSARTLLEAVTAKRDGRLIAAGEKLKKPRQK